MTLRYRTTISRRNGLCMTTTAYDGRDKIGRVRACRIAPGYLDVSRSFVIEDYRFRGVGRAMYRALSERACSEGLSLRSMDYQRSKLATALWRRLGGRPGARGASSWLELPCAVT